MEKPQIIAFHLPQFHTFPENDEWWGKGFTDWTNVKKAKPLFKNHNQPREPLNGYYDMTEYKTRRDQNTIAKEYNIDAFCYYHYWFNGKLLMEKPIELLLNEKENDLKFCLCWANENWTRAWNGQNSEVLILQDYGGKDDWEKHIQYLLPFFKDNRYIKIENKPIFIIYRTKDIPHLEEMIEFWNTECIKNGFEGIYVVEELNGFQNMPCLKSSSAILDFEPNYTQRYEKSFIRKVKDKIYNYFKIEQSYILFNYDVVWKKIIARKYKIKNKDLFLGAFVDWDNSPRRKKYAKIFYNTSVEKFDYYFSELYKKAINNNSRFIFINAWNEWAEGTYLEADLKNGYGYLECIKRIVEDYK